MQHGSSLEIQERKKQTRFSAFFFFFPLSLLKLNCQVTDLNKEASISFNNNSGKPTLVKVLCCSFLVFRLWLKKKKKKIKQICPVFRETE